MAARRGRPPKKVTKTPKAKVSKRVSAPWWKQYSYTNIELIRRGLLFLVLVYVVINYRGLLIAATVNGEPISRLSIINKLEESSGLAVLDNEVNEVLIRQKARDSYVTITQDDINAAIANIEENVLGEGQSIDDVLAIQGMTRQDLEKQLEVQVMVEKLLEGDVTVTEEEVNQFVEGNRESISETFTEEDLRSYASEQLRQQKLTQRFATWIQELRDEANINFYVEY